MKFHLATASGKNFFTGYGTGYVVVNQQRHQRSMVVMPQQLVDPWDCSSFDQLSATHFEHLAQLKPEIVLLGTGSTLRFPPPQLTRPLIERSIGLEVMDTSAACRTYNILVTEGRNAAAAILLT